MMKRIRTGLAAVQYGGLAGISRECQDAILRLLQYRDKIIHARILTCGNSHSFLLTINTGEYVAVKSGFGSGYGGEGPRTFSYVLRLLKEFDVEVEEIDVPQELMDRLDDSALTRRDITWLISARPQRPSRWYGYIYPDHWDSEELGGIFREFPPVIPFAIIDSRIHDLAVAFWERPDEKLMTGYRRLEDIVRARIGVNEHSYKLFSIAFVGVDSKLRWPDIEGGEHTGRGSLFTGAYLAYRNPRAHREPEDVAEIQLAEFLLLNHLYVLERQAVDREEPKQAKTAKEKG